MIARGWRLFIIMFLAFLNRRITLASFKPPVVEPDMAPENIRITSSSDAEEPHSP